MNIKIIKVCLAFLIAGQPCWLLAQNQKNTEERLERLEKELQELRQKQNQGSLLGDMSNIAEGLSWGAYGEIKYVDHLSDYKTNQFDVNRVVLLTEYRFNDWIDLLTEFEYEHAGFESKTAGGTAVNSGEVFVEQAYINFKFSDALQLRPGLNLLPVGPVNLRHEPTTFLAVERPRSESYIIPSTWREIGFIMHGDLFDKLNYQIGVVNGPRGAKFSESSWIRGGRTKGSESRAENLAAFIALKYNLFEGIELGTAYYRGDSGQGEIERINWQNRLHDPLDSWTEQGGLKAAWQSMRSNQNKKGSVRVHIAEGHITLRKGAWMGQAMFVQGWISDNDTRELNKTTGQNIGKLVEGSYGEIGFNVLSFFNTDQKLYPYIRLEYVNTQKHTIERHWGGREDQLDLICAALNNTCKTTANLDKGNRDLGVIANSDSALESYGVIGTADRTNDQRIVSLGAAWFPHPGVVVKAEYERQSSKSRYHKDIESRNPSNNKIDRIQMAVGFNI
ncbi:MAG: hypothetical protein KDK39_06155 [Leptospiraceae bacterium]|nr:hypothetical protein [Leptospiraceae bacterium]